MLRRARPHHFGKADQLRCLLTFVAQGAEKRHDVRVRNGACEQVLHDGARFRSSQVGAALQFF